ncbi:MAG: rhodanese-like domain-containing protein [Acetobacteraceae bacterium]
MTGFFSRLFGSAQAPDWIEPAELAAHLEAPDAPLVVDVRSPAEFGGPLGHIPGAVNIPLDQFASRAIEATGQGRGIVLVCHTDRRSSAAAHHLRGTGVNDVAVLRGGMSAWTQAGLRTA